MEGQTKRNISVIEPLSEAFARTKLILFDPFSMEKWFIMGFCAWLAQLGSGGGSGSSNWSGGGPGQDGGGGIPADFKNNVVQHLPLIITIGVLVFVVGLIIGLVVTWLNSRGRFMFLDCVANNTAEVKRPWTQYRELGNSLFKFRVVVGFIIFFLMLLLAGAGAFVYFTFLQGGQEAAKVPIIFSIIGAVVLLIPLCILFGLITKFTNDFVVPIMYLRHCKCTDAWREFLDLAGRNKGILTLYVLFGIIIGMGTGAAVIALALGTCCLACCVMAIPYLGTVLLLPIITFVRCYSLYFLRQFGDQYDVFPVEAGPEGAEPFVPVGIDPFE